MTLRLTVPTVPFLVGSRCARITRAAALSMERVLRRIGRAEWLCLLDAGDEEVWGDPKIIREGRDQGLSACVWTAPDGHLRALGRRAAATTGLSVRQLFDTEGTGDLVDAEGTPVGNPSRHLVQVVRTGRAVRNFLVYSPSSDRWLLVNLEPLREVKGGPVALVFGTSRRVRSEARRSPFAVLRGGRFFLAPRLRRDRPKHHSETHLRPIAVEPDPT